MRAPAAPDRDRRDGGLRWLADAYARYAHLVHDQIQALDEGDLDRLASLAAEREALAGEIDDRRDDADTGAPGGELVVAQLRHHLRLAADADRSLRRRLGELRTETHQQIEAADESAGRTLALTRTYGPAAAPGATLDVTF